MRADQKECMVYLDNGIDCLPDSQGEPPDLSPSASRDASTETVEASDKPS
jgi:hypothetical protein